MVVGLDTGDPALVRTLRFGWTIAAGLLPGANNVRSFSPSGIIAPPASSIFRRFSLRVTPRAHQRQPRRRLLAAFVERYGYGTIRGSTSRKGASALLRLAEVFAEGTNIVITPDGPRGPVYELGQGVIFLAQKCNAEVVPGSMEFSISWRFKSWDRFFIPRPFSTVRIIFGVPLRIADTPTPEEFEAERQRLQNAVMEKKKKK